MPVTPEQKALLKKLLKRLHRGESPDAARAELKQTLADLSPIDIALVEEELIKDGMSADEVHRMCDVHLALFKEQAEQSRPLAAPGHPVHILMEEHRLLLEFAAGLREAISQGAYVKARTVAQSFRDSANHYLREENVLFPHLEKHGITQPPKIMWLEHDSVRAAEKELHRLLAAAPEFAALTDASRSLSELLSNHFYKENNILFPTALRVIPESEWDEVRRGFVEVGWCPFTPQPDIARACAAPSTSAAVSAGMVEFDTGSLPVATLEAILNHLPVDVSFVDAEDKVRYYSDTPERIFTRTKAVLGRSVQNCHPPKSLHVVTQILDDFRGGRRKSAEFWINLAGKVIHIRYFAVHDKSGEYLGCLEVSQDITAIQKLQGQKRLL